MLSAAEREAALAQVSEYPITEFHVGKKPSDSVYWSPVALERAVTDLVADYKVGKAASTRLTPSLVGRMVEGNSPYGPVLDSWIQGVRKGKGYDVANYDPASKLNEVARFGGSLAVYQKK